MKSKSEAPLPRARATVCVLQSLGLHTLALAHTGLLHL
jgi:hypothetical protein